MYCLADLTAQDEDLARRVYAYFIFRLRQPEEAERLTRLSFERVRERERLNPDARKERELPLFAAARAVVADNPRPRGASKVRRSGAAKVEEGAATGLGNELAMAIGRLDGREREALALRFGAELSVGEIVELIDGTPADVKQRLARGVRNLLMLGVLPKESRGGRSTAQRPRARSPKEGEGEQDKPDR
jgi:DNA-directed RNA polymerase specialized sigma24 family protein